MWTDKEISILLNNSSLSLDELALLLPNKTRNAIRNKRSRLKASPRKSLPWTDIEKKVLVKYYGNIPKHEMLEKLSPRDWSSIQNQVSYLRSKGIAIGRYYGTHN